MEVVKYTCGVMIEELDKWESGNELVEAADMVKSLCKNYKDTVVKFQRSLQ